MNILIGDIGNTNIKICLIEFKTFKIKKLIHFKSNNIYSQSFLKIDDVDSVSMGEDVLFHLRVPSTFLVPEVNSSLQQRFHCDWSLWNQERLRRWPLLCWRGFRGRGCRSCHFDHKSCHPKKLNIHHQSYKRKHWTRILCRWNYSIAFLARAN